MVSSLGDRPRATEGQGGPGDLNGPGRCRAGSKPGGIKVGRDQIGRAEARPYARPYGVNGPNALNPVADVRGDRYVLNGDACQIRNRDLFCAHAFGRASRDHASEFVHSVERDVLTREGVCKIAVVRTLADAVGDDDVRTCEKPRVELLLCWRIPPRPR